MKIKIDKQYDEPWKVMKAASEGRRVAARNDIPPNFDWIEQSTPAWNWSLNEYAIIDESQPEIDWGGFDWAFFEPYGGVPVMTGSAEHKAFSNTPKGENTRLRESPFYPWFGGECPVPENVEVEYRYYSNQSCRFERATRIAKDCPWDWENIADFRLTGRVL